MIKAIIFDFDGTLIRLNVNWRKIKEKLNNILKKENINEIKFGPIMDTLNYIWLNHRDVYFKVSYALCKEELAGLPEPIPHKMKDSLQYLKSSGFKIVMWSRNCRQVIEKFLEKLKVKIDLICSRETFIGRGDKSLDVIFERLKINPDECIVVTDHPKDIRIAKNAGCFVAGVRGTYDSNTLLKEGADIVLNSVCEVVKIIDEISGKGDRNGNNSHSQADGR